LSPPAASATFAAAVAGQRERAAMARHAAAAAEAERQLLAWEQQEERQRREKAERVSTMSSWALEELTGDWRSIAAACRQVRADKGCVLAATRQHAQALLAFADEGLVVDRDAVLAAVRAEGGGGVLTALHARAEALCAALRRFGADRELMLEAVRADGESLQFACAELRADRELALAAVSSRGTALEFVSEALKRDKEVVFAALQASSLSQDDIPVFAMSGLCGDKQVVLEALQRFPESDGRGGCLSFGLDGLPEELQRDAEVVVAAIGSAPCHTLGHIHRDVWKHKEVLLAAVRSDHEAAARHAPELVLADKEAALALLGSGEVSAPAFLKSKSSVDLMTDFEVAAAFCGNKHASDDALAHVSNALRADKRLVLIAVKNKGTMLRHASEELRNDQEVVLAAVSTTPAALQFASARLKAKDEEVRRAAGLPAKSEGRSSACATM